MAIFLFHLELQSISPISLIIPAFTIFSSFSGPELSELFGTQFFVILFHDGVVFSLEVSILNSIFLL